MSLKQYGGDDGLSITGGSQFAGWSLDDSNTLYYASFGLLCAVLIVGTRFLKARFGMTLAGIRVNERRMKALGVPTLHYKLCAYVLSAITTGVAGMLYANLTHFTSPSYLSWTSSGELIVMVVIGGIGTLFGPVVGTLGVILLETGLKSATEHWMIFMGAFIVIVVLVSRRGLVGFLLEPATEGSGKRPALKELP